MNMDVKEAPPRRSYVISLENRKARGAGCERPAEILKAARELFLTQGVETVTTRQIAARVGISQTALYVYFSSKEEMLDSLAEEAWRGLAAALAAADPEDAEGSDPVARLRAILSAYMRFWLRRPDDYRLIFMRKILASLAQSPTRRRFATRDGLLERLAKRFEEAAAAGLARDSWRPDAAALAMWAAVSGPVALRLAFPDLRWPPEDEHVKATIDMIIQGCDGGGQGRSQGAGARARRRSALEVTLDPALVRRCGGRSPHWRYPDQAARPAPARSPSRAIRPALRRRSGRRGQNQPPAPAGRRGPDCFLSLFLMVSSRRRRRRGPGGASRSARDWGSGAWG